MVTEKLQKILSQRGIASRRGAEAMILAGRVMLNGSVAFLGQRADPWRDEIRVDGALLRSEDSPQRVYLLVHKPAGFVSTCRDPQKRKTVLDLLPVSLQEGQGIHPVGRLDTNSTGALLLTNDGELTFQLTHPRHEIAKTYEVWVMGHPSASELQAWRQGVMLDGRRTLPAQVRVLCQSDDQTCLEIMLKEGRNRQIRRVAEQLGHPVKRLHRVAIGSIRLERLRRGQYRFLTPDEIAQLKMPWEPRCQKLTLTLPAQATKERDL